MSNWIAKLFEKKATNVELIRFIRTEYQNDVRHLKDEDVISYYNNINKRRA